jgi:gentisate 1,2-dioxygenase
VPAGAKFHFPWRDTLRRLEDAPSKDGVRQVRYGDPLTGGPVLPTLEARVIEIDKGKSTRLSRVAASQLCVVIEGSGSSRVSDAQHEWSARDIFTIHEWAWTEHRASERSRLLVVDDSHFRRFLGLYREEIQ